MMPKPFMEYLKNCFNNMKEEDGLKDYVDSMLTELVDEEADDQSKTSLKKFSFNAGLDIDEDDDNQGKFLVKMNLQIGSTLRVPKDIINEER